MQDSGNGSLFVILFADGNYCERIYLYYVFSCILPWKPNSPVAAWCFGASHISCCISISFFFPLGLLKLSLVVSAWYISHLFREKLIEYTVVYFLQCIRSNVWYCNMLFYGMCVLAGVWCASWVICPSKLCCISTEIDSRSALYNFYVYIIFNVKTSYLQKPFFFFLNIFTAAFYSVSCRY